MAVDIPIGLTNAGRRQCDAQARALLGAPRGNSVFPAPIRPAINASSRAVASQITQATDGRKVGAHAWGIFRKVRDLDAVLVANVARQHQIREIHPELSFWAWNGSRPMAYKKKSKQGELERRRLIDAHYGNQVVGQIRIKYRVGQVGHDDIQDALAALWTAERIVVGTAIVIPDPPPLDSAGLRMEIWY
jgi:predicted RNase H-like nuclease